MPKTSSTETAVETSETTDTPEVTRTAKLKTIATNPMFLATAVTATFVTVVLAVKSRQNSEENEAL